jgi:hypothetical protein
VVEILNFIWGDLAHHQDLFSENFLEVHTNLLEPIRLHDLFIVVCIVLIKLYVFDEISRLFS